MTRVLNADQFRNWLRGVNRHYVDLIQRRIARVREQYAATAGVMPEMLPRAIDDSLEAHGRAYLVNGLLAGLNWRLDCSPDEGLPDLVPEAPIESLERGTTRYLDYLGLERETDRPLLIVEAKRPSAHLPGALEKEPPLPSLMAGLAGEVLAGQWNEWIATLRDYVRSCHRRTEHVPRRVVICNGDWLILFMDPAGTFLLDGIPEPTAVRVYSDREDVADHAAEIFLHLEHSHVLGEAEPLTPTTLPLEVRSDHVVAGSHGLHLSYSERPRMFGGPAPVIEVAPTVVINTIFGTALRIERRSQAMLFAMPPEKGGQLAEHLAKVRASALAVLNDVSKALRKELRVVSLADYYRDMQGFDAMPAVFEHRNGRQAGLEEYFVLTGAHTHYLLQTPIKECPFHSHPEAVAGAVDAMLPAVYAPSTTSPRSFFASGETYHCAHGEVTLAKMQPITQPNRERCGYRSGANGQAFCEIARWEERLCCRACAFQDVCTATEVFRLPC